jgi:hypothetical protein
MCQIESLPPDNLTLLRVMITLVIFHLIMGQSVQIDSNSLITFTTD